MGFKCPICFKEYGNKQKEFIKHIKSNHSGIAYSLIEAVEGTKKKIGKKSIRSKK